MATLSVRKLLHLFARSVLSSLHELGVSWPGSALPGIAAHGSGPVTIGTPGSGRWRLPGSGSDLDSDGPKMLLPWSDSDEDLDCSRKLIPDNLKTNVFAIILNVCKQNCYLKI